jgi:hypothetical protein
LLHPFEVASRKIRIGDRTPWGYERADFDDAFKRYLPSVSRNPTRKTEHAEQANVYAVNRDLSKAEQGPGVPVPKHATSPMFMRVVPDVPVSHPITGTCEEESERSVRGDAQ